MLIARDHAKVRAAHTVPPPSLACTPSFAK